MTDYSLLHFLVDERRVHVASQLHDRLESAHSCYSISSTVNDLSSVRRAARAGFPCRAVRSSEPSRRETWTARLFRSIMKLFVRNFEKFQHYKKRRPPWIQLHRSLLDNREFQNLPDASRALAPMLWLLATEKWDGMLDVTTDELAWRLRKDTSWLEQALQPLINAAFFVDCKHGACRVLAECLQHSSSEAEAETETEAEAIGLQHASTMQLVIAAATPQETTRSARRREQKKLLTTLPENFQFTEEHRRLAEGLKLNVSIEYAKFKTKAQAKGYRNLDWNAAFRNWIINESEYKKDRATR